MKSFLDIGSDFMKNIGTLVIAIGAISLAASSAQAAPTEYTNAAAFNAAVTSAYTYNFEGIAPDPSSFVFGPQTIGGVTFNSTGFPLVWNAAGTANYGASFFSGQSTDVNIPSDVIVTLAGTNAISFEYGAYGTTPGSPVTIAFTNGDTFYTFSQSLPPTAGTDTNFVGFVSETPMTSFTFSTITGDADVGPNYGSSLDVIRFTLATPVPEPESYAMLIAGLGLLGLIVRRKKQKAA